MNSLHRMTLQKNYVEMVRSLDTEDVTDYLYQEGVLSEEDCEKINAAPTRAQRVRDFLSILPTKSKDGLPKLLSALEEAGYDDLSKSLKAPLNTGTVDTRDPHSLKERLQQQSVEVASMQAEMEALQADLDASEWETSAMTGLSELQKGKKEKTIHREGCKELVNTLGRRESRQIMGLINASACAVGSYDDVRKSLTIKCVLLGSGASGKSSILQYFIHRRKIKCRTPTVVDNHSVVIDYANTQVNISFWDTAGREEYDQLRPLSYSGANVALLVFSISDLASLNNILDKWYPEFRQYCHKTPVILVANKIDAEQDPETMTIMHRTGSRFVKVKEADKAAESIKAFTGRAFLCSAYTGDGILELLHNIVKIGLKNIRKNGSEKSGRCCALL